MPSSRRRPLSLLNKPPGEGCAPVDVARGPPAEDLVEVLRGEAMARPNRPSVFARERFASADVADKITRQLTADLERLRKK